MTHSYFNAAFTTVADALQSGNTTLITNAMVYRVLTDPSTHKATGVMYIDRVTREVREVRARAVLLCAQALESDAHPSQFGPRAASPTRAACSDTT